MIGYALDLSNYSGVVTAEWCREAWAQGFRRAILSTYDAALFGGQYDALAAQGFELDAYCYLNFPGGRFYTPGQEAAEQIATSLAHMGGRVVGTLWLDCEDDAAFARSSVLNGDFIADAAAACRNHVFSGVYTRRDWWRRATGDSQAFASYRLWDCTNDDTPDLGRADYGGWGVPYMEQYSFQGDVGGLVVDLDCYGVLDPVMGAQVTNHDEMQAAAGSDDVPPRVVKRLDIAQADVAIEIARAGVNGGHSTVQEVDIADPSRVGVLVIVDRASAHAGDPSAF